MDTDSGVSCLSGVSHMRFREFERRFQPDIQSYERVFLWERLIHVFFRSACLFALLFCLFNVLVSLLIHYPLGPCTARGVNRVKLLCK